MAAPLVDRAVGPHAPAFVGREREVAALRKALIEPVLVLVEGEAGVGKSRLVRELLATAHGQPRTLLAACPPHQEPLMLGPLVEALRRCGPEPSGLRLSALAGALRPLFPEWAPHLPPAPEPLPDQKAARHRLFRALAELLEELDVTALVVEDVHWADLATLEFLLLLTSRWHTPAMGASRRNARTTSLIVTYRPEDLPADSLLLRLSSRLPAGSRHLRVPVPPLEPAGTARLVSSMLGDEPVSDAFATFLHERTDGVPLAVEESVRLLGARGDLIRRGGEWVRRKLDELQVPPTVRDAVLERVSRLGQPAQQVLAAAAVLATPTDEVTVARVAELTGDQARQGLTEAIADGMLREDGDGRAGFRHVLMGQAVYEAIPPARRRLLHQRAGETLEALTAAGGHRPLEQLTRHFREAAQPEQWTRYAELAADRANESGDYDAVVVRLNDALTWAGMPAAGQVRLGRKLALAASYRREAVDDLHRQAADTLRRLLDTPLAPAEEAELRSGFGRLLAQLGEFEAARTQIERAVPWLRGNPVEAARAMLFLGLPFVGDEPAAAHRRWLQRAADIDQRELPSVDRLALIVDRAAGLLQLGDEAGWTIAAELPTGTADADPTGPARSAAERREVARGHLNIGAAAVLWGWYGHARRLLRQATELADADRNLRLRPQIMITEAQLDWHTGAWDGLTEQVTSSADPDGDEPLALLGATRVGLWHLAQGSHRSAETELTQALAEARRVGTVDDELEPSAALGRLLLREERVSDALRQTGPPMQTIATKGIWVWATDLAPVRVAALLAAGDLAAADQLVSAYRRGLRRCPAPAARAALATCRALLAEGHRDLAGAAIRYAAAARAWQQLPRPYDALLARERQAHCELATGQEQAGLSQLAATFQALRDLGARGDADRVAQRLREHGVEVRREWRRGRRGYGDRLSPRELDVVRLVATGATNREVATALSRSPKTVAGQLSSAMRKLGTTSRTELAVDALRNGLLPADENGADQAPEPGARPAEG